MAGTDRDDSAIVESRGLAPLTGVILCGGRSRRMGRDKAELDLAGEALLDRVIGEVSPVTRELVLACGSRARYGDRGMRQVLDLELGAGPLAGIAAALEVLETERALVVACDMPRVRTALVRALAWKAEKQGLDVCWFESLRGLEPLCAVYSRRCAPLMRAALSEGRCKVTGFIDDSLRVGTVRESELERELRELDCAVNLNTPEDLAAERAAWKRGEQA